MDTGITHDTLMSLESPFPMYVLLCVSVYIPMGSGDGVVMGQRMEVKRNRMFKHG